MTSGLPRCPSKQPRCIITGYEPKPVNLNDHSHWNSRYYCRIDCLHRTEPEFFAPELATRIGLNDPEEEMDRSLYLIETRANGLSDILTSWIFPLSGFLMLKGQESWPFFALVGGGIYIYFAFLTVFSRVFLKREGFKVGSESSEMVAYAFSIIWIANAATMIVLAIKKLTT